MKKIVWLLLAVSLLCGCGVQTPQETAAKAPETTSAAEETVQLPGIYVPDSELEILTNGTVRCYDPNLPDVYGLRQMNDDVLVFSGTEQTTLTRYTGRTLVPAGQVTLNCRVHPQDSIFQISDHGITYFDAATHALVYLDNELKEVSRMELPADMVGKPVLSADRTLIYYCTPEGVRVYDIGSGLDRLLKSIAYPGQSVEGLLMDGSVLHCVMTDDRGQESSLFLSARTGETLMQTDRPLNLMTQGEAWCAKLPDGLLEQVIFGTRDTSVQALYPRDPFGTLWVMSDCRSAVTVTQDTAGAVLDLYELEMGTRTATLELPAGILPLDVEGIAEAQTLYLLALDTQTQDKLILRWDYTAGSAGDEAVYTARHYTEKSPDEEGLSQCAAQAQTIGAQYGVTILTGPQAAAVEPADYTLKHEYQVALIRRELRVLEEALRQFPEGFFDQLPGEIHICILRSITGNAQTGSVARAKGVQFWDGDRAFVALEAGDDLYRTFFHEIFHIIDSKVLSTTRVYYHWENHNPEGCEYFLDFTSYLTADVSQYLEDENRAFIDAYSMCYPREDRARIMEYACTEGNDQYFRSSIMQSKLKTLCEGIRKAFGLEAYREPLIWEQYLAEPMKIK